MLIQQNLNWGDHGSTTTIGQVRGRAGCHRRVPRLLCDKKLGGTATAPRCHSIATDLGIEKNGTADVQYHEIERVIAAVHSTL